MKRLLLSALTKFTLLGLIGCDGAGIEPGFAEAPPATVTPPPPAEKPTTYKRASNQQQAAEKPASYR